MDIQIGDMMQDTLKIAVIVGSARKGSINRAYAGALEKLAGDQIAFDYLPVGDLPLYNTDLEADEPKLLGKIGRAHV